MSSTCSIVPHLKQTAKIQNFLRLVAVLLSIDSLSKVLWLNKVVDNGMRTVLTCLQSPAVFVYRPANSKSDAAEGEGGQGAGGTGVGSEASQAQQQHQQFLGDTSLALPTFGSIDTSTVPLPDGVSLSDLRTFEKLYKEHAEVNLRHLKPFSPGLSQSSVQWIIFFKLGLKAQFRMRHSFVREKKCHLWPGCCSTNLYEWCLCYRLWWT